MSPCFSNTCEPVSITLMSCFYFFQISIAIVEESYNMFCYGKFEFILFAIYLKSSKIFATAPVSVGRASCIARIHCDGVTPN